MTLPDEQGPSPFLEASRWVNRRRLSTSESPEPWVVAVSGGSDSVGLLRYLHAMGIELSVAHLDHGTRGEASRLDAEFVGKLAETLQVPFDLGHWEPSRDSHFESDARKARLDWLASAALRRGASAVVLGHTLDDQAETVLHRTLRGTGLRGLAGIPSRRRLLQNVVLLRPFLGVTRQQIRDYLALEHQGYREDESNTDLNQTRARLRHDLIPKLEADYNPKVVEALARLAGLASEANRALERPLLRAEQKAVLSSSRDHIVYSKAIFTRCAMMIRVELLRLAFRRLGWPERAMTQSRWKRLARLADETPGRFAIGSGVEVEVSDATFMLQRVTSPADEPETSPPAELPVPGQARWEGVTILASLEPIDIYDESIDFGQVSPPLIIRGAVQGDRFEPLGLEGQGMALNDFFRGRNVARADRRRVPLICDQTGILWVAGHRISHRVRIVEGTTRRLWLRFRGLESTSKNCSP